MQPVFKCDPHSFKMLCVIGNKNTPGSEGVSADHDVGVPNRYSLAFQFYFQLCITACCVLIIRQCRYPRKNSLDRFSALVRPGTFQYAYFQFSVCDRRNTGFSCCRGADNLIHNSAERVSDRMNQDIGVQHKQRESPHTHRSDAA